VDHILRVLSLPAALVLRGDTRRSHAPFHFGGLWRTSPLSYPASVVADLLSLGWVGIGSGLYPISRLRFAEVTILVWRSRFFIFSPSSEECLDGQASWVTAGIVGSHWATTCICLTAKQVMVILEGFRVLSVWVVFSGIGSLATPLLEFLCSGVGPCRTLSHTSF
jgi:hypothetical protein